MLGPPQKKGMEATLEGENRRGRSWPEGLAWGDASVDGAGAELRGGRFWGALPQGQPRERSTARVSPGEGA